MISLQLHTRLTKHKGNYNNEIGLPYTVLHMPDDTEKLVLEIGLGPLGETFISYLKWPNQVYQLLPSFWRSPSRIFRLTKRLPRKITDCGWNGAR